MTYYKDEDGLHPRLNDAFKWWDEISTRYISTTYRDQAVLAGGALRSFFTETPVRDYDIYLTPAGLTGLTAQFNDFFQASNSGWAKTSETDISYTFTKLDYDPTNQKIDDAKFNINKKPFTTHDSVIDSYDFTVCMCAISPSAVVYHPDYFIDLSTRRLRVHNPGDPFSSLWRLQKYIKMGYTIDRTELWKMAEGIHQVETLPAIVDKKEDKYRRALKENAKTLEEIFRSS